MSIPSVAATGRSTPLADRPTSASSTPFATPTPASATTRPAAKSGVEVDRATQQPVPLRFPWLSRLSQQLESASGQRPPFERAPVLGDNVDRSV